MLLWKSQTFASGKLSPKARWKLLPLSPLTMNLLFMTLRWLKVKTACSLQCQVEKLPMVNLGILLTLLTHQQGKRFKMQFWVNLIPKHLQNDASCIFFNGIIVHCLNADCCYSNGNPLRFKRTRLFCCKKIWSIGVRLRMQSFFVENIIKTWENSGAYNIMKWKLWKKKG